MGSFSFPSGQCNRLGALNLVENNTLSTHNEGRESKGTGGDGSGVVTAATLTGGFSPSRDI